MLIKNQNKMKKISLYLMMTVLSLIVFPTETFAKEATPISSSTPAKELSAEVKIMLARLDEIKAMDKSSMKSAEKKELRKEVRAIKSSLKAAGNGVYFSVGAIIIIILLLILIL